MMVQVSLYVRSDVHVLMMLELKDYNKSDQWMVECICLTVDQVICMAIC